MKVGEPELTRPVERAVLKRCRCRNCTVCKDIVGNRNCERLSRNTTVSGRLVTKIIPIFEKLDEFPLCRVMMSYETPV